MSTATAKAAPAAEISTAAHPSLKEVDRPANLTAAKRPGWGSDVIAESLRDLEYSRISRSIPARAIAASTTRS